MNEPLIIVGNKDLTIKEKYDLIVKYHGIDYVNLLSAIISVASVGRCIGTRGTALSGDEWKQRVEELIGELMDEGLNPFDPMRMMSHISIVGHYRRWLRKNPARACVGVSIRRKYPRKTMSHHRDQLADLCRKELARTKAEGPWQDTLHLLVGHTDQRAAKRTKMKLVSKFPRPTTIVMGEILDDLRRADSNDDPILNMPHKELYSEARVREHWRRHHECVDQELRQGFS